MNEKQYEKTIFSLILFNIHHWLTKGFKNNERAVTVYIKKKDASFVCFNEVVRERSDLSKGYWCDDQSEEASKMPLPKLAKECEYNYYFGTTFFDFGNAILAKSRIFSSEEVGSEVEDFQRRNIVRIAVELKDRPEELHVFCLHIDHIQERVRLRQLQEFFEKCISKYSDSPLIVCGDFNAIRKDDYTEEKFSWLCEYRKTRGWEPSYEDVVNFMNDQRFVDVWKMMNLRKRDNEVVSSQNIPTRIDYIFVNYKFLEIFHISSCDIDRNPTISDHFPIIMTFSKK